MLQKEGRGQKEQRGWRKVNERKGNSRWGWRSWWGPDKQVRAEHASLDLMSAQWEGKKGLASSAYTFTRYLFRAC